MLVEFRLVFVMMLVFFIVVVVFVVVMMFVFFLHTFFYFFGLGVVSDRFKKIYCFHILVDCVFKSILCPFIRLAADIKKQVAA